MLSFIIYGVYHNLLRCKDFLCAYGVAVKGFVVLDGFCEWDVYNLVVLEAYHYVALALEQCVDSCHAKAACEDAVVGCGATATLQVSKD